MDAYLGVSAKRRCTLGRQGEAHMHTWAPVQGAHAHLGALCPVPMRTYVPVSGAHAQLGSPCPEHMHTSVMVSGAHAHLGASPPCAHSHLGAGLQCPSVHAPGCRRPCVPDAAFEVFMRAGHQAPKCACAPETGSGGCLRTEALSAYMCTCAKDRR